MRISSINSYQNFSGRIKINKSMLSNISKDAADIKDSFLDSAFSYSTNSIGLCSRGILANPVPNENGFFEPAQELVEDMGQMLKNVSHRNISPSVYIKSSKGKPQNKGNIPS